MAVDLPAGWYSLTVAIDDAIRAGCGAPVRRGEAAHPIMAFVAALGGLGVPIAEVCRLAGSGIEVGPMLASCAIRYAHDLQVDRDYRIEARLAGVVRKASRRFGAADHAQLEIALMHADVVHAEVSLRWILPVRA